ncbi:hypothetical protein, partial [Polaribacter sp.]|uniref:hypothetical protein n=1 Tax=Polaribacter sp. TaxID=1920175 RepID=UPI003EF3D305
MNPSIKKYLLVVCIVFVNFNCVSNKLQTPTINNAIKSIDTDLTILKVRTAINKGESYVVATSFEGTVLAVSYEGEILWKNKLSGFMIHDIWCQDINGDGIDEIVTANADGNVYCLNNKGKLLWTFKTGLSNPPPMYAVSVVNKNNAAYVVCGGFDKSIYYVSNKGELVKEIKSATFSIEKPWGKVKKEIPESNICTANFIRSVKKADGSEILVVLGTSNNMNTPGTLYFFNPMEDVPFKKVKIEVNKELKKKIKIRPIGDFKVSDINNDGNEELILGTSAHAKDMLVSTYDLISNQFTFNKITKISFGYDITHTVVLNEGNETTYLSRVGSQIHIYNPFDNKKTERLMSTYAYNDMCKDKITGKVILASSQSGGSSIHIIDTENKDWKKSFKNLQPIGKIAKILVNTKNIKDNLDAFKKPNYQKTSQAVFLLTEKIPGNLENLKNEISTTYDSPVFLNSGNFDKEKWDRSSIKNDTYRNKRDRRMKYKLTQEEILEIVKTKYEGQKGYSYWGGHGNDPYMYQLETTKKILDIAAGKKTVLVYPELEDHSKDLDYVLEDLIYPLAKYSQSKNANIFLRSKNIFWLGSNYLKAWSRLMSGEFADVFVPSMEETTDKSMELSLAGRMGIWASGSVDSWGTRAVPDNASFDRSRQLGYQRLPNHFLRMLVFHTANGAQFINNFAIDQDYMSLYWELIAKGALYVPKRSEILSISPIHLSMKEPDHHFLNDGSNVKWTTFYDEDFEKNNPFVMSRLNGTWPGAPITDWDFSKYAAGVKERRLNFLAPYENGLVLITPTQNGIFAQKDVVRSKLSDNLHPLYKNIMKEYITDGRNYYSADGKQTFKADEYYKVIEKDLKESAKKLPIIVSGDVAWVVAQTSPKHLRLTIIDNGYINPEKSTAIVHFNNIKIKKITDVLNKEVF